LLFFAVFWVFPFLFSIFVSFTDWNILGSVTDAEFRGFGNYFDLLRQDLIFRIALRNTFTYVMINVPVVMILALGLALVLKQDLFGRGVFRTVAFIPRGASVVALALIWRFIYSPTESGVLNTLLIRLGLPIQGWLSDAKLALPSVMLMDMWYWVGSSMVIFLVALFNIPQVYYEAAKVDGANSWHCFRHVTLPLLRPTFLFAIVTGTIGAFQVFAQIYIMTEGGPANGSEVVVHYMYKVGFEWLRMGDASAMAIVLLGLIMVFVLVEMWVLRARD
jgi:ABC-type sugar transport system permease subunit